MDWKEKAKTYSHFAFDFLQVRMYLANSCNSFEEVERYIAWLRREAENGLIFNKSSIYISPTFFDKLNVEENYWKIFYNVDEKRTTEHFESAEPIKWEKSERLLVYLFELLYEQGFIKHTQRSLLISKHFINQDGKPFDNKQLNSAKDSYNLNKQGVPQNASTIQDIVKKISK
jgi:hypothetical protein